MPNNTKKECKKCNEGKMHLCTVHYPYFTKECKHLNIESNMCPETCKDCGVIIDKNKEEDRTKAFGMNNGGSHVNYTGSLLREEKCICGRKKHEWTCKPYVDSVVSPSSNEDWEIEFDKFAESQVISFGTRQETKYLTDIWATAYKELKDFIRTTRLGAQRELTEEIINYMEDGLDEPTDWYVSVKNFLSSRGLLPKITE
jgi:hypothetical protein